MIKEALPSLINKYQVQSGRVDKNIKLYLEVSETISGGYTEKVVLGRHNDHILFYSDLSERFNLVITERPIDNGDRFIFVNLSNLTDRDQTIKFSFVLNHVDCSEIYDLNDFYREPEYSKRYGKNKLSTPSKYVATNIGSVLVSKCFVYMNNNLYYENQTKSITRKLHYELDDINVYRRDTSVHVETITKLPAGMNSDIFFIMSDEQLFSSNDNLHSFFNDYAVSIQNNDVRFNMWLTPHGSYTKLPYSIEPFDRDAYGISLHHMSKKEMYRYYNNSKDRFYYDMMYNAIIQLFGYRPEKDGLFLTDYTSTWLKKDYHITAPYIDTRLNETVSLAIEDFRTIISFNELENYHLTYGDFLVNYSKSGELLKIHEQAYFFPDYFPIEGNGKPAHSSLNHQLGILNYLLNKYKITQDKNYEIVSNALLTALEITKDKWITEENDLYYKVYYRDGELHYEEKDYVYVTLIDLLLVQENLITIYNNINRTIHELILRKMTYLQNNKYGLDDENALLPPNEDIASRYMAQKLAKRLNYLNN